MEKVSPKFDKIWPFENVETALDIIAHQKVIPMNMCIFVDALDEHKGDHRMLLAILKRLAKQEAGGKPFITLCLASRSEAIFSAGLSSYPGFTVHDHTAEDIRLYASDRMESSLDFYKNSYDATLLDPLLKKATGNAHGVSSGSDLS